jgi:fatty-acyl-CoA synthase
MLVYIYIKTQNGEDAIMPKPAPASRTPQVATNPASSTYDLLRHAAELNPDGIALTFLPDMQAEPARLTYRQFSAQLHQAANAFHRLGVRPDSVVSLLAPGIPEAFVALWAAEAAGIANPINFLLRAEDIAAMLRATRTELLIALGPHPVLDIWQKVQAIRPQVPSLKTVLTVGPPDRTGEAPRLETLRDLEPGDRLVSNRVIAPHDVAAYFHTGGSTGAPKIAVHTHANQVFAAASLAKIWDFGPSTRLVNALPLFHVAGSLLTGLAPLGAGAELLVPTAAGLRNPEVVAKHWAMVKQHRPTVIGGIPTSLVALLDVPLNGADIGSVKFCATGGAPLPPDVANEFQKRFGLPVLQIYGMTECAGLIAVAPAGRTPDYAAAGYRISGIEIEARTLLADGGVGQTLAHGESGVLVTRGPHIFEGYLDKRQTDAAFTPDGWLITGDLGSVDASGLVRVTGRVKDVIIRSGHNIDPVVIEEAATRHPAVAVSAAVGLPDAYAGEVPILYVTLRAGAQCNIVDLETHMRESVPEGPARPREVVVLDAMPMTAVGKIDKPAVRRDATRRAALAAIAPHAGEASTSVDVTDDATGQRCITLTLNNCAPGERDKLAALVADALRRFNFRHEIVFV